MLYCCLCDYHTRSVIHLYKHNSDTHHQELNSHSRYSLTSCIRCNFSHSNPNITKLHTEISHKPKNKVLYITHHRFVSRAQAIQQAPNPNDIPTITDLTKLFGDLRTKFKRWDLKYYEQIQFTKRHGFNKHHILRDSRISHNRVRQIRR